MQSLAVPMISVDPAATLRQAGAMMHGELIGAVGVMRHDALVGIFTERDLVGAVAAEADLDTETVERWMTPDPDTVEVDVEVAETAAWMLGTGYRHLPVTDGGRVVGIVSIKDVLWAIAEPALDGQP